MIKIAIEIARRIEIGIGIGRRSCMGVRFESKTV
jgi:hypothetical protein